MAGNSNERGRGVISKAVPLFEAFRAGQRELSLNQLARRTGLPISTVYRAPASWSSGVVWSGWTAGVTGSA